MMHQQLAGADQLLRGKVKPELQGSAIAIIDDLESNRSFLEHLAWRQPGVRYVSIFSSAIDALKGFSRTAPDLVITDFHMPGMNAVEFLEAFRQVPDFEDIPVIVISTLNEADNRHRALLAGATDFLMVPFDPVEFQARTRNLLRLSLHQKSLRSRSLSLHSELLETRYQSLQTQHRFTSIIDSVPALVFAVNAGGECVFANQYCFEFSGISPKSGVESVQFLANKLAAKRNASDAKTKLEASEISLTGRDRENHVFLIVPKLVRGGTAETELIVYSGIEITQLKDTEHSLRKAKDQAEAANRAKSAFLSNMTHEIRTPLNAIIGFTDVMCSELYGPIGNAAYQSYLRDIQTSANHLLSVLNEILEFSQVETGPQTLHLTRFHLKDCLDKVEKLIKPQLSSYNNLLRIRDIPKLRLHTDSQKLTQVLLNLLANANQATRNGTVRIAGDRAANGDLIVTVNDDGIGMDAEELALAATEFGRAMTTAFVSDEQRSVGLGLPISLRLMKLLGGDLEIESEKGQGTTARIRLPVSAVVEEERPASGSGDRAARSSEEAD